MANLKTGSSGPEVRKLQQALIKDGYDVGNTKADGVLGPNTAAALKQYQKDHGLAVDGIAGPKTLGLLYGGNAVANTALIGAGIAAGGSGKDKPLAVTADGAVSDPTNKPVGKPPIGKPQTEPPAETTEEKAPAETTEEKAPAAEAPTFVLAPSATVQAANQLLQQHMNSRPGAYQSQWQDEINKYMDQYINRDPFSYDFNSDALYQMYKDMFTQQGQMVMMDTMGQAAAMTGGYGNSYAQTVGQQAYNQQLAELNNIIPELYQMAYGKYRDEGQDMLNAFNMYMDRDNQDYGRHQDNLNNWWRETEYLTGRADTEYERDYNTQWDTYNANYNSYWDTYNAKYKSDWDNYTKDYQEGRDTIKDQNDSYDKLAGLISSTGYKPTADELKAAGMSEAQANALRNAYDTGAKTTGGNDKGNNPSEYDNGKLTTSQVKMLQKALGVTVDGKWGDNSFEAAGGLTADEALKAYQRGELGAPKDPGNPKGGLDDARKDAIYDWIEGVLTNPNLSASFDPNKLISGSSFLTSDEERAYAKEIIGYLATLR